MQHVMSASIVRTPSRAFTRSVTLAAAVMAVGMSSSRVATATEYLYDGGSTTASLWSDQLNWNPDGVPGTDPLDTINQTADPGENIQVRGTRTIDSFTWATTAGREIQSGSVSTLTITNALTKNASGTLTFRPSGSTALTLNIGSIALSAGGLNLYIGNGNANLNVSVSGTTSISGGGTLTLDTSSASFGAIEFTGTGGRLNTTVGSANGATFASGNISVASLSGALATDLVTTNTLTAARHMTLGLTAASGTTTYAGQILDRTGTNTFTGEFYFKLTKSGGSTQILTGTANTYSGGTEVSAGTLLVDNLSGNALGSGLVTVSGSGRVGGTGFITAPVSIGGGAKLLGGDGTAAAGTLTLSGDVTFAADSAIELVVGAANAHSTLARTGGTWTFDPNQTFSLVGLQEGTYDNIITGLAAEPSMAGWKLSDAGYQGTFTFDGSNIDLVVSVPEPATMTLLLAGLPLLLRRRRHN